jgi:two-component system cell cycle sensor histidine kinase/response regulator CckA
MEMTGTTDADTILADPSQVQQILMNLATNAAYAMSENGGKLTVSYSKRIFMEGDLTPDSAMGPGEYFELTLGDTGIGMAPDTQKRIFEPFFTTKGPGEGTGMGLAVVFGIAQTLRGAVTVKSEVGKGSTFTVFLPLCPEASEEESEESSFPKGSESILVVDDEPSVLEVVTAALKQLGYRVTMARDGSEGLAKFRDHPEAFDLVVTDHVMPDLTGVKLAQKMLQIREDIPIILFSGFSETISPEKARSLGIKEFLMKPIMKRQLAETVRKVLDS